MTFKGEGAHHASANSGVLVCETRLAKQWFQLLWYSNSHICRIRHMLSYCLKTTNIPIQGQGICRWCVKPYKSKQILECPAGGKARKRIFFPIWILLLRSLQELSHTTSQRHTRLFLMTSLVAMSVTSSVPWLPLLLRLPQLASSSSSSGMKECKIWGQHTSLAKMQ